MGMITKQYHRAIDTFSIKAKLICLLALLLYNFPILSSPLYDQDSLIYTTNYLVDVNSSIKEIDVLNGSLDNHFQGFNKDKLQVPTKVYWLKLDFSNRSEESKWVLEFEDFINFITLYINGKSKITGNHVPFKLKDIPSEKNVIELSIPTRTDGTFYLKIENKKNIDIASTIKITHIDLWKIDQLSKKAELNLTSGLYLGVTWLISIILFIFFISTKDRTYLYYCLYLLCFTFYELSVFGYYWNIIGSIPQHFKSIESIFLIGFYISFYQFLRHYFNLKKNYSTWNKIFIGIINLFLILFLLRLIVPEMEFIRSYSLIIVFIITITFFVKLLIGNNPVVKYIFGGSVLFFFALIIVIGAYNLGIEIYYSEYLVTAAIIGQIILFSIGLAFRLKFLWKEKDESNQNYIDQLIENEKQQKNINQELIDARKKILKSSVELVTQNESIVSKNKQLLKYNHILQQSEKRYKDFSNLSSEAIFIHQNGIIKDANKTSSDLFGYDLEELEGLDGLHKLVHPEDIPIAANNIKNEIEDPYVIRFIKKDGTIMVGLIKSKNIIFKNEKARVSLALDITESINSKNKLRKSEAKFRDLFEKSKDAILFLEDGFFKDCNQATVELLGYDSKEEFLGSRPSQLSPTAQPDGVSSKIKVAQMINIALKNGSNRFEWLHTKKNGENFPVEVLLTTISKKPSPEIIHTIWRDITDRKKAEQKLTAQHEYIATQNKEYSELNKKLIRNELELITRNKRIINQGKIFLALASLKETSFTKALQKILKTASKSLNVERVGFWNLVNSKTEVQCDNLYIASDNRFENGLKLAKKDYTNHFKALENRKSVIANNAITNPNTKEFAEDYFTPLGITSTIDVYVNFQERNIGAICFEHVGKPRIWKPEEVQFAFSISNLVSLLLESDERKKAEQKIQNQNKELEYHFTELEEAYTDINLQNVKLEKQSSEKDILVKGIIKAHKQVEAVSKIAKIGGWEYDILNDNLIWSKITKKIHQVPPSYKPVIAEAINFYKEGESRNKITKVVESAMNDGSGWNDEFQLVTAKGKTIWVRALGQAVMKEGKCIKLFGTFENINIRKIAELKLLESENKYKAIFNSLTDVYYRTDSKGIIELISPSIKHMIGYSTKELVGKQVRDYIDFPKQDSFFANLNKTETVKNFNTTIPHKSGILIDIEANINQVLSDDGHFIGVEGLIRDVTYKRLNRDKNKLLTTAIENLTNQVMITDNQGIVQYVNNAYTATKGYSKEVFVGKKAGFMNHGHAINSKEYYRNLWDTINKGIIFKGNISNRTKDNKELQEELIITPILGAGNEIKNFVAIYNDITTKEKQRIELDKAHLEKEQLKISAVLKGQDNERKRLSREIHDGMGQLLSALKIQMEFYIKTKQSKANNLSELQSLLGLIESAGQETKRISYGLLPSVLEDFGLKAGLKKMVDSSAINSAIKITFDSNITSSIRFNNDIEINLYRIAQETVNNALKHSKAKTISVSLILDKTNNNLILNIKDNGIGFGYKKKIERHHLGNGLINIEQRCKTINAKLVVTSSKNKGTHFSISLKI